MHRTELTRPVVRGAVRDLAKENLDTHLTLEIPLLTSVLPTKGSAPMSFARASVRRELNHEGQFVALKSGEVGFRGARRVENLIATTSEDFTNAAWIKNAATAAIVGGVSRITATATTASYATQSVPISGTPANKVFRVTAKLRGSKNGIAGLPHFPAIPNDFTHPPTVTHFPITTEWGVYTSDVAIIGATASASFAVGVYLSAGSATFTTIGDWIEVEWIQLEDITGQSNQNPSEYVSVGEAKLNEYVDTELFTGATWTKTSSTATAGVAGPTGALNATTITATANNARVTGAGANAVSRVDGVQYTVSLWARRRTGAGAVSIYIGGNAVFYPLTLTTDWQRFSYTWVQSTTNNDLRLVHLDVSGDEVDIFGAQLERDSSAGTYFPVGNVYPYHGACVDGAKWFSTENPNIVVGNVVQEITGVAVPEIPYPQVLKGYCPMPAATNLLTYSGDLTNAAWTKAASVASIATYPPRLLKESLPSQLRDDSTAASIHGMFRNPTVTANTNYCAWLVVHTSGERFRGRIGFLDAATSSNGVICEFNARTGVTNAAAIGTGTLAGSGYIDVAKGWGIVYVSGKIDAATTAAQVQFLMADSAGNLVYDGDGVSRMILGHFQLETGTVPTSVIPTTSATVTVAGDTLSFPSALVDSANASFYAEISGRGFATPGSGTCVIIATTGSSIRLWLYQNHNDLTHVHAYDATNQASVLSPSPYDEPVSCASSWSQAKKIRVAANGAVGAASAAIVADIRGTAMDALLGSPHRSFAYFRVWNTALTDAELIALTRNGYDDTTINTNGWVDSPQISHDGRRLYFMYSRYDFAPLLIDGAGLADLVTTGPSRPWHVAIPHPSYDADVYCAYLRHDGTVERIENLRFDPNYDDFSLQVGSAESSIMEVAATASLPKRIYYNANRVGDVPKLVYRQENANGSWTAETVSELSAVSSGGSGAGYIDDNAFVTDDRLALVFASNRPGGQGSHDLWLSLRAGPTDPWGAPTNAGANINTAGHEDQVFLHPNGTDVFFTRDGGLYHCTRAGTTINNDDTLITFTGPALAGGIGEPSTDAAMNWLYFSYLELATKRIRIMRAPWGSSVTAWGTPVPAD